MAAAMNQPPIAAKENERQALKRLDAMLQQSTPSAVPELVGPQGERIPLPEPIITILRQAVHHLAHNRVVAVVPINKTLTTQEAADILNISRPYFIRLLDGGALPFVKVGAHRRIRFDDVMAYKRLRDEERQQALDELAALNEEMGLYEN